MILLKCLRSDGGETSPHLGLVSVREDVKIGPEAADVHHSLVSEGQTKTSSCRSD